MMVDASMANQRRLLSLLSGSYLCRKAKKKGVDNVNTFAVGLGRRGAGLARIAHVYGSAQCLQGRKSGSSPTSGTVLPQVSAFWCLTWC
jgi:hypothetical protein